MNVYALDKPSRVCAATGRELIVGEQIHSVLFEENGRFIRRDYSASGWSGLPAGAFAHWMHRLSPVEAAAKKPIDDEVLFECFDRAGGEGNQRHVRYVLGLLLMRRKRLVFVDARKSADGETLILRDRKRGQQYAVVDPGMTEAEIIAVQEELFRLIEGG